MKESVELFRLQLGVLELFGAGSAFFEKTVEALLNLAVSRTAELRFELAHTSIELILQSLNERDLLVDGVRLCLAFMCRRDLLFAIVDK